mmetsp:Transcript_46689/g.129952  ORF Transcript_46689/g.129952 Transcript_46689/m.129952 type:complete len:123 (+) Transcript_46689:2-370(+)
MLVRDARDLTSAWDCAKGGRLQLLTADGRLLSGQDDAELLRDVLGCGQGEHPLGTVLSDAEEEPCSRLAAEEASVQSDGSDECKSREECNESDKRDPMPAGTLRNSCKRWLCALVGRRDGLN